MKINHGFTYVTERSAIAVYNFIGCGDPKKIDLIASNAIREALNDMEFGGQVVVCEGQKDESHGLFGERVGKLAVSDMDVVCDPVDGSTRCSNSQRDATCLLVLAPKGTVHVPTEYYMKKIVTNKQLFDENLLSMPIKNIAEKLFVILHRKPVVSLLKRDRNKTFVDEFRNCGCRVKLIDDCDVLGSLEVFTGGIDLFYGIGGSPEAILATSAVKAYGGIIECQSVDKATWQPTGPVLRTNDLISGHSIFIATGITDSNILDGVKVINGEYVVNTLFTTYAEKGTIRKITTYYK